jgi:hypothetical protein
MVGQKQSRNQTFLFCFFFICVFSVLIVGQKQKNKKKECTLFVMFGFEQKQCIFFVLLLLNKKGTSLELSLSNNF